MKRQLVLAILLAVSVVIGFGAQEVYACNFAAGESWCGNCGYTCIQKDQYCPAPSECASAGEVDLRNVPTTNPSTVCDANGNNCQSKPAPTPPPTAAPAAGTSGGGVDYSAAEQTYSNYAPNAAYSPGTNVGYVLVACDCDGNGLTDRMLASNSITGSEAAAHCANVVCSAIGTNGKVCQPGTVNCIEGTQRGYVCKDDGSGYHDTAVNAHACGYTWTRVDDGSGNAAGGDYIDPSTYDPNEEGEREYTAVSLLTTFQECVGKKIKYQRMSRYSDVKMSWEPSSVDPDNRGRCLITYTTSVVVGEADYSIFIGCGTKPGTENQNCYRVRQDGEEFITCYYEPGISCGANIGMQQETAPTPTPTPTPTPSPTPTPTPPPAPQCNLITPSQTAPGIGDQVSFTCDGGPANLITRYEFRYGFTSSMSQSPASMQSLSAVQGQPNLSQPITIDQVGRYVAQCRPCTAAGCLAWEPVDGSTYYNDQQAESQAEVGGNRLPQGLIYERTTIPDQIPPYTKETLQ